MTTKTHDRTPERTPAGGPAAYLNMSEEQRKNAQAHAALLSETAARVAVELPLTADVDDFRRVLAERAAQ
jgi:hypothetical protein